MAMMKLFAALVMSVLMPEACCHPRSWGTWPLERWQAYLLCGLPMPQRDSLSVHVWSPKSSCQHPWEVGNVARNCKTLAELLCNYAPTQVGSCICSGHHRKALEDSLSSTSSTKVSRLVRVTKGGD